MEKVLNQPPHSFHITDMQTVGRLIHSNILSVSSLQERYAYHYVSWDISGIVKVSVLP